MSDIPDVLFRKADVGLPYVEILTLEELYERFDAFCEADHDPFAPHRVSFFLVLVIDEGRGHHFIDLQSHTYQSGSILFVAKNQIQAFTRHAQGKGYAILFTEAFLSTNIIISQHFSDLRLFNCYIGTPVIHAENGSNKELVDLASQMYREFQQPHDFVQGELLRNLLQVLLLRAERIKHKAVAKNVRFEWLNLFIQFKNLLENGYASSRNARDYAQKMRISYKHLNDICKAITNRTPKQFIDHVVTTEIQRHLVSTPLTVKEISSRVGFDEPANMIQYFRRQVGQTPLQFRNALK